MVYDLKNCRLLGYVSQVSNGTKLGEIKILGIKEDSLESVPYTTSLQEECYSNGTQFLPLEYEEHKDGSTLCQLRDLKF